MGVDRSQGARQGGRKGRRRSEPRSENRSATHAPAVLALPRLPAWALAAILVALVAATVVVFAPLRHADFVQLDDPLYISENPQVAAGLTRDSVSWAFTTWHAGFWIPATWLSYMVNVQMFGLSAGAEHLCNVALHLANTLLLFGLLARATGSPGRSVFVAALFALHPLHVESVAWITERKDVLSTLFSLLAALAYVGYVRRPTWTRYAAVFALFALGLMAKPMLVTLPVLLLLLDVWPLQRLALPARSAAVRVQLPAVWALIREKVPLFAASAAAGGVTVLAQRDAIVPSEVLPMASKLQNAAVGYVEYILRMAWPARLSVIYFPRQLPGWWVVAAAIVLAAISVAVVFGMRRRPYLFVGWAWYLVAMLPVIGLVQVGFQSVADRFTYVPMIGLFVLIAWGAPDVLGRWRPARALILPIAVLLLAALAVAARAQVAVWKDNVTLFTRATEVTLGLDEYHAHLALAEQLQGSGRMSEAAAHLREAVRLRPDSPEPHEAWGVLLTRDGNDGEAVVHFREAVRLAPGVADRRVRLGVALAQNGNASEAISELTEALRLDPSHPGARRLLEQLQGRR